MLQLLWNSPHRCIAARSGCRGFKYHPMTPQMDEFTYEKAWRRHKLLHDGKIRYTKIQRLGSRHGKLVSGTNDRAARHLTSSKDKRQELQAWQQRGQEGEEGRREEQAWRRHQAEKAFSVQMAELQGNERRLIEKLAQIQVQKQAFEYDLQSVREKIDMLQQHQQSDGDRLKTDKITDSGGLETISRQQGKVDEHLQRSQEENTKATVMDEVPIQKRMAFIKARLQQLDDELEDLTNASIN